MRRGSIFIIILLLLLFPVYALDDNQSVYINGVIFYNILLASHPVLVGEIDYSQVYFTIVSQPTIRGESLAGYINSHEKINITKVNEIKSLLLKDNRIIGEDLEEELKPYNTNIFFRFKDQPDYHYFIRPWGILVVYVIPQGKKLTIEEFKREKIKFLNETTERLRDLWILRKLDLETEYWCAYCDFKSGFSYTLIIKISNESNETYSKLMNSINYGNVIDQQRNMTILFKNGSNWERIGDVICIGPSSPPILRWYEFIAYSNYNYAEIKRINKELEDVGMALNNIRSNLEGDINSTEAFSILENISMSKNGTVEQKLHRLITDIKSADYFVKISKEIENRPHAEWLDVLFGLIINENINRNKQVNDLYEKYNMLENQRQDLFDITVAIYSAALQREGVAKQLKNSWIIAIITIIIGSIIGSGVIQWCLQTQQSKKQEELTQKQIKSYEKNMQKLIDEIRKLKFKEQKRK